MEDTPNYSARHRDYRTVTEALAELLIKKNDAYGDSFNKAGKILEILYPEGVLSTQIDNMLTVARILDKLSRIADGDPGAFEESPWQDIAGYAVLALVREERRPKRTTE